MKVDRQGLILLIDLRQAEQVLTSSDAIERPIAILDGAVRELDRFGLLVFAGGGDKAPRTPGEVRRRWKAWLRSRDAEMQAKCAGVAMVTTSAARAMLLRVAEPAIRRMFHAPTAPFADEPSARAWLSARLDRGDRR
jgi:hypothetical protein